MSEWKETELGKIPNEWDLKTVAEIKSPEKKSIISGPFGSNISAKYFVETGVPVIRGNNLSLNINRKFNDSGFVFITEEKATELGTWAEKNDIIFTAVGTIGQVGILMGKENFPKYIISNKQLRLRVNEEIIEPLYAYYWFASPIMVDIILQRNTGSSVPLINLSVLKSLLVPIPPKNERVKILSIITSLDDKIDLLHRQNATMEAMAETLFRQWFVEEAKENWEEGKLSDLVVVKYGKAHKNLLNGNIPVLGSGGVMRYADSALYNKESVLIPRKGTLNNVMYINEPFWTVDTVFYTEMRRANLAKFIFYFVKGLDLASMNVGSAVPSMTTEVLNNIALNIPPDSILKKFELAVTPLYKKMKTNQIQICTLTTLRDTLLPKLMSGEVRVEI